MKVLPLLLLIALAHTLNSSIPFTVSYSSQFIAPAGQNYEINSTMYDGHVAYILFSGGRAYAVFPSANRAGKFEPSQDQETIANVLYSYYYSSGYSPLATDAFDVAHQSITSIAGSRKAGENACRILLGTDRNSCTDFDSCQKACYSVTSFCEPVALGTSREFINVIFDFENDSRALDAAYAGEEAAYDSWKNGSQTAFAAWNYLHSLEIIDAQSLRAASSPLYSSYAYCFSPNYQLANLTAIVFAAQGNYQNASHFLMLYDESQAAVQATQQGLQKRLDYEKAFNQSLNAGLNAVQNPTKKNAGTGAPPYNASAPPPAPSSGYNFLAIALPLLAIVLVALVAFAAVYLVIRGKKKGK